MIYAIHSARRFVFWWFSWLNIGLVLAVQILFAINVNLGTVRGVMMLAFTSGAASTLAYLSAGIAGFAYGPRAIAPELAILESTPFSTVPR